ncbi:hypothetical protein WQE_04877 [Paraburkholderia hospita]|uniref:Uncharacterized protein n=1 Tax=Paraburkholderia hospita TaxID=169430 RepID=A0ABN0FTW6_9BURK|nr:hypothetical protein [Paraburkholderia hospita]EIN02294.1 hypothetical protein WQE_04877 [Paraburkholderia hospita]OUL72644.1 hypothetical protein CA602_42945 [Paraburkholderia hospita]
MRESRDYRAALDAISNKAVQLAALLNMCYGNGFENFKDMTDEVQGNVLWLASDLAEQIVNVANGVQ